MKLILCAEHELQLQPEKWETKPSFQRIWRKRVLAEDI
jgi:hypothetical protein